MTKNNRKPSPFGKGTRTLAKENWERQQAAKRKSVQAALHKSLAKE